MQRRARGQEEGWLLSYADLITNLLLFFVVLLSAANLSKSKMQQITKAIAGEPQPESLESLQKEIDKAIVDKKLQDVVQTKMTDEGLLLLNSGFVFESGRAELRPEFIVPLTAMLERLKPFSGKQYSFAVEGHTDSTPIVGSAQFKSNWDLSAGRAIVVRERLEQIGIDPKRIRVEGYADTRPLPEAELKDLSVEARNARLRRVVVRVY